ncbi:MAG: hypothetical protein J5706_07755 [Elusimicrobiales bacterium]|nr:hypothetical protein [Elusimicrobiales bacterium]
MENLLEEALELLPKKAFTYRKWLSRTQNAAGIWVNHYGPETEAYGSIQPIEASRYAQLGLDFEKHYVRIYTSAPIRYSGQNASDMVIIDGTKYKIADEAQWQEYDGWTAATLAEDKENAGADEEEAENAA